MNSSSRIFRIAVRAIDLIVGGALLLLSIPIILLAALAIRLETPGNPFFVQTRVGLRGRPFSIFKLRGMYANAPARYPNLYDYSRQTDLRFRFHHENDPRVTHVGGFLRRASIDELPNFLNVVLGDMSLIGPRPEVPEVMALYGGYRDKYLSIKPGVTCLSKISGRDVLTKEESVLLDLEYIDRRTLRLDAWILWITAKSVLLRKNVFGKARKQVRRVESARAGMMRLPAMEDEMSLQYAKAAANGEKAQDLARG